MKILILTEKDSFTNVRKKPKHQIAVVLDLKNISFMAPAHHHTYKWLRKCLHFHSLKYPRILVYTDPYSPV